MSAIRSHTPTPSTHSSSMRLLVPMPVPRTPNAPYFDQRGVTDFLNLILQHGSNAGIDDPDELVSFIVRYSSDRVREVIQYIPEIDIDEPNRTWKAAREQLLLLYGSSDQRRVSESELIEFCRQQSAKSPYHTKQDIEQYLRDFQWIAAPLLKQHDITAKQRDFYFVSGIPRSIKQWFISRVPEHQRTRSNPVPLADSLGILYGYFDPDTLFPDVWNALDDSTVPVASTSPPAPESAPPSISNLASAISARLQQDIRPQLPSTIIAVPQVVLSIPDSPQFDVAPMLSPESMIPFRAQDTPDALQLDEHHVDLDSGDIQHEDPTAQDDYEVLPSANENDRVKLDDILPQEDSDAEVRSEVLPSDELPDGIVRRVDLCAGGGHRIIDCPVKEGPIYFCGTHELADNEPAESLQDVDGPTVPCSSELIFANMSIEENANLARFFAELLQQHVSQMSSPLPLNETDDSTVTGSDVESLFDFTARSETDLDTDARSSSAFGDDTDFAFEPGMDFPGCALQREAQATKFDEPLCKSYANPRDNLRPPSLDYEHTTLSAFSTHSYHDVEPDELANSPRAAECDSSHSAKDIFQPNLRTPFEFYTEPLSQPEPFSRAEPFFPCASYVDYFVPELFDIEPEVLSCECLTELDVSEDAPPSYQESLFAPTSSCVYGRPRIKAEFMSLILTWMFACLSLLTRWFCTMISAVRMLAYAEFRPEIRVLSLCESADNSSTAIKIVEDAVPPDKTSEHSTTHVAFGAEYFRFIILWIFARWNLFSRARLKLEAGFHANSEDDLTQEEPDVEVMYHDDHADDAMDLSGQDDIELRADAIPPDKSSFPRSPDPFLFAKYSVDSELIFPFSQDFEDEI
ncbi:hypothetical protein DFH06DRAFT_1423371 [Mycena polygramma]|nr:hypothetical protein DFH06DRAFT_1423368 [Mycena polygramma]KAJ7648674.1 hypothetical protein DFH06DRAFT_1423371 [Mycena polygramma]